MKRMIAAAATCAALVAGSMVGLASNTGVGHTASAADFTTVEKCARAAKGTAKRECAAVLRRRAIIHRRALERREKARV